MIATETFSAAAAIVGAAIVAATAATSAAEDRTNARIFMDPSQAPMRAKTTEENSRYPTATEHDLSYFGTSRRNLFPHHGEQLLLHVTIAVHVVKLFFPLETLALLEFQ